MVAEKGHVTEKGHIQIFQLLSFYLLLAVPRAQLATVWSTGDMCTVCGRYNK